MAYKRSSLVALAAVIIAAVVVYLVRDTLVQGLGLGGTGSGIVPATAIPAEQSVVLPERVASSLRVEAAEEREFPIENEAVGSIDFNEDMTLQVFAP